MEMEYDGALKRSARGRFSRTAARLALLGSGIVLSMTATAQPPLNSGTLPLSLAMDAAAETIQVCGAKGFRVAVSIVDPDGVIKLQARGDGSPIHSQEFSFRKAYTVMSMGPMAGVDANSALVGKISSAASSGTSNLLLMPGAVLVKQNGQAIAAVGVSGAPKSVDDELCAQAGADKIKDRVATMARN